MRAVHVRGVPVATLSCEELSAAVRAWILSGARAYVSCASVHLIEIGHAAPAVREALCAADLVLADGAPVAWAARWLGGDAVNRVTGSDVFELLSSEPGSFYRHFFYGSTPAVLDRLVANVGTEFPEAVIVGAYSPPFIDDVEADAAGLDMINAARPDIVWVGLGAPKQDLWMHANRAKLDAAVLIGVGAVFDFVAGTRRRAPIWMRRRGVEWLFRLAVEPRRLWRRYLVTNTTFVFGVVGELASRGWQSDVSLRKDRT